MSDKFKTVVTTQGLELLNQAIANEKDLLITKAVASSTAYNSDRLLELTDTNYNSASHDQETTLNRLDQRGDGSLAFEILFDGYDVRYDYTLNTVFLIAEVDGKERLFAVIKANQPQYINSYEGGSRTNLQINFALQLANQNVAIKINAAALATLKDLDALENKLSENVAGEVVVLNNKINTTKKELTRVAEEKERSLISKIENDTKSAFDKADKNLNAEKHSLENKINEAINDSEKKTKVQLDDLNNRFANLKTAGINVLISSNQGTDGWSSPIGCEFDYDFNNKQRAHLIPLGPSMMTTDEYIVLKSVDADRIQVGSDYLFTVKLKSKKDINAKVFKVSLQGKVRNENVESSVTITAKAKEIIDIVVPIKIDKAVNEILELKSEILSYDIELWDEQLFEGTVPAYWSPNPRDLMDYAERQARESFWKAKKIIFDELKKARHAPTAWTLDRSTTPWTLWFDNGCGLQISEYDTMETIYGYGYGNSGDKFVAFPLVANIINCSKGTLTLEDFVKRDGSDYIYWSPTAKVIEPLQDGSKFDWSNAVGNRDTNNDSLKRKPNFARVMYELGIWSDADVESLGAVRR